MSTNHECCLKLGFPKWDGLVDFKNAELRAPKSVFLKPDSPEARTREICLKFVTSVETTMVSLRPDGGDGFGKTPSGINFCKEKVEEIVDRIKSWNCCRLGVVLLESHSRFDYDFCCNFLFENEEGSFSLEFVGPGFDGGDLNKSILLPTTLIKGKCLSILDYCDPVSLDANEESLSHLSHRITITNRAPSEKEIHTRLMYISTKLLPDMGVEIEKTAEAARKWLIENGYRKLFESKRRNYISIEDVRSLILSGSRYAHYLKRQGEGIGSKVITAHKYNGKIIFFGAYNSKKWKMHYARL